MSGTVSPAPKAQPHVGAAPVTHGQDMFLFVAGALALLTMPLWGQVIGAGYPDLMQKFAIYGIFAMGFNLLFGLTGYLSFGHAAFLGAGSYMAVWSFKLLGMSAIPAVLFGTAIGALFALLIGFITLRRAGIYFSILTLAFAEMSYKLAYSVLTPITNGETGLRVLTSDPRILDSSSAVSGPLIADVFGLKVSDYDGLVGFYFCAVVAILMFYVSIRIFRSPFGLMLRAIKTNQNRLNYTGVNTRPYALTVFVISGAYAGLAGSLMGVVDPLAGAERMQWTASGEVVLMTILGGAGTLLGPILGAAAIKYFENIFSAFNKATMLETFDWLPDSVAEPLVSVLALFVGEGWHLTLGVLFMLIVIFLPGGIVEGLKRIGAWGRGGRSGARGDAAATQPAE